jgi:predicted nucleotidyltransferase
MERNDAESQEPPLDWPAVFSSVGIQTQKEIDDYVVAAFVTGSRAWGTAEVGVSDWDLIIVLNDSSPSLASLIPPDASFALLDRFITVPSSSTPIECNVELMPQRWFWNELILDKANLQAISCLYLPEHMVYKQAHPEWRQQFEAQFQPWRIVRAVLWKVCFPFYISNFNTFQDRF